MPCSKTSVCRQVMADRLKHRIHVDAPLNPGDRVVLDAERAHYIVRVLRLRADDRLLVFNGDGSGHSATIVAANTKLCELDIGAPSEADGAPAFALCLAQSLIKGDRLDYVLQKATELGVTDIELVTTERTEVAVRDARLDRRMNHWQKVIVSAAEQCGRLRLPTLHAPIALDELINQGDGQRYLLDPGAAALSAPIPAEDTRVLIGPEGGFSGAERTRILARGYTAMGLGSNILRADTAPIAALAVLRNGWGWQAP